MSKNMEHIRQCLTPVRFYQTTDGKSFAIKSDAVSHQSDIIGELLDALIPENEGAGFYRRVKQHVLLQMLNDSALHYKLSEIVKHTTPCTINDEDED